MNTTDRIKEQIETLVKNIDKIRAEENITLPTLMLLETMSNYFDSFDFYREFADRYTKLSLPYSYSTELIKTTSPIVDDLEELTNLLRSTNSIRDKELADTFDLFLNSVQFAQVINDQNFVKENNTEQDYELDQYLGKIKSVDIVLDDQGNFGITFDLSFNAEPTFVIINKIKHPIQASDKQGLKYNVNVISETRKIENYKLNSTTRENGIVFKVNNREVFAPVDFKLSK